VEEEKKFQKKLRVTNACGLHTRPATLIVQCLQECTAEVFFTYKKDRVDARSILNLLMLAVQKNGEVLVEVIGLDAHETLVKIEALFLSQFGESEQYV
jgi:phosphocarrier protein